MHINHFKHVCLYVLWTMMKNMNLENLFLPENTRNHTAKSLDFLDLLVNF